MVWHVFCKNSTGSLRTVNRSHGQGKETGHKQVSQPRAYEVRMQISWRSIPQGRRKALSDRLRAALGAVVRELARQKESKSAEEPLRSAHGHCRLPFPPNLRSPRWGGISQGRGPSPLRGPVAAKGASLSESTAGREAILSRRWAETSRGSGTTLSNKKRRTRASSKWRALRTKRASLGGS